MTLISKQTIRWSEISGRTSTLHKFAVSVEIKSKRYSTHVGFANICFRPRSLPSSHNLLLNGRVIRISQSTFAVNIDISQQNCTNAVAAKTLDLSLQHINRAAVFVGWSVPIADEQCSDVGVQDTPHAFRASDVCHQCDIRSFVQSKYNNTILPILGSQSSIEAAHAGVSGH